MCGEKMMKAGSNCAMLGSPPRMRGKECRSGMGAPGAGITPAYAGKRAGLVGSSETQKERPRVCGEKSFTRKWFVIFTGSPPRMRGKV